MKKAKEQNHEGEKQNAKKSALGSLSVEKHYFPWTFSTGRACHTYTLGNMGGCPQCVEDFQTGPKIGGRSG